MAVPLEKFFAAPLGLWDIFYDLLPQHWRAGLNSSAARRAWDPHAFGHWLHIAGNCMMVDPDWEAADSQKWLSH